MGLVELFHKNHKSHFVQLNPFASTATNKSKPDKKKMKIQKILTLITSSTRGFSLENVPSAFQGRGFWFWNCRILLILEVNWGQQHARQVYYTYKLDQTNPPPASATGLWIWAKCSKFFIKKPIIFKRKKVQTYHILHRLHGSWPMPAPTCKNRSCCQSTCKF